MLRAIAGLRGKLHELPDGSRVFVTIHPSFLLRIKDKADKERAYRAFVADPVGGPELL